MVAHPWHWLASRLSSTEYFVIPEAGTPASADMCVCSLAVQQCSDTQSRRDTVIAKAAPSVALTSSCQDIQRGTLMLEADTRWCAAESQHRCHG